MSALTPTDLHFVVTRIPRDVRALLTGSQLFLGGGFVRETIAGGVVKDIDLFGPTLGALEIAANRIAADRGDVRIHRSPNAITVLAPPRLPLQFITKWLYTEPAKLAAEFDFTVCQVVIWFADGRWQSVVSDAFYADLAARRLVYTFPVREELAGGSMLRARKFLQRGYNIQAESLAGVIARLAHSVRNIDRMKEADLAQALSGLLREVDPLFVVDGLDFIDEHEVNVGEGSKR